MRYARKKSRFQHQNYLPSCAWDPRFKGGGPFQGLSAPISASKWKTEKLHKHNGTVARKSQNFKSR